MSTKLFLGGRSPPGPARGRARGTGPGAWAAGPHPRGGGARPHPPAGEGLGKPGFPRPLLHTNGMNPGLFLGGGRPPRPARGRARGAGPGARAAGPHLRGGGARPHPPAGEGLGKPGFPRPLLHTNGMNPGLFLGGRSPPGPARGRARGAGPGARASGPHLRGGGARPHPPAGEGLGKPGFPSPLLHTNGMNPGLFLGGRRPPGPARGRVRGTGPGARAAGPHPRGDGARPDPPAGLCSRYVRQARKATE